MERVPKDDRLLRIPEAAEILNYSVDTTWSLVHSRVIPSFLLSPRARRVRYPDLIAFIESKRIPAFAEAGQ